MKPRGKELGTFIILVVLCALSAWHSPTIFKPDNLQNTGRLIGIYGIFSVGMGLVIITGGIDLSVGSVFALLGVLLSVGLVDKGWSPLGVVAVIIAGGAFLGYVNGLLVARVKLQPFIVTLCGLLFYRGLARFLTNDETKGFGDSKGFEWVKELAVGKVLGIPYPLVILAIVAGASYVLLHRCVFGRHLFAVGRNEEAARYAGIDTKRVITTAYVLCGVSVGISAVLFAFYTNSISPSSHGNFYELYAIAAAVLGGCSLRGGEGSVIGILLGTALLQILRNLVNLLHIPSSLEFAVMGTVILIGVLADSLLSQRQKST